MITVSKAGTAGTVGSHGSGSGGHRNCAQGSTVGGLCRAGCDEPDCRTGQEGSSAPGSFPEAISAVPVKVHTCFPRARADPVGMWKCTDVCQSTQVWDARVLQRVLHSQALLKAAAPSIPMGMLATLWPLETATLQEQWRWEPPFVEKQLYSGKDVEKCGSYQMVDSFLGTVLEERLR